MGACGIELNIGSTQGNRKLAIVQISRITQRKGLQIDLPQLSGGEFGWSIDSRRLFIGNGTLAEGAPEIGNTEILTEFSDILALSELYTYKGEAAGYTVQTGPTPGTPVTQSLQSWLDQFATIKDFGAVGDGQTDDTAAINRALYQIYCRESNPQIRRGIFFPAGVYKVSDTIVLPPYAMLWGEGADSSVISFEVAAWTNAVNYNINTLVSYSGNYYRAVDNVPTGVLITDTSYWNPTTLPDYVVRTGDSLQQTGANIGTNGATPPKYISVNNLGFSTTSDELNVAMIEDASNCDFYNVKFSGPRTSADLTTDTNPTVCLDFASTASLITSKVNFENCLFSGCTYAVNTDQQLNSTVISESRFETLYKGVLLGTVSPVSGGPNGVRVIHNSFDQIYAEGIIFGDVSLNGSAYNIFYDVGNHFGGAGQPYTPIIDIQQNNNISLGDMFERDDNDAAVWPRIEINDTASIAITNAQQLALGTYVRETGKIATLLDNTATNTTIFTIDTTQTKSFTINYSITRDVAHRVGAIAVAAQSDGVTSDLNYADDYTQNQSTGIGLTLTQSGTNILVQYTSTSNGFDSTFTYSIARLA